MSGPRPNPSTPARLVLGFERPLIALEDQLAVAPSADVVGLRAELARRRREVFSGLSAYERVQLARHPGRPYALDYWGYLLSDVVELRGDRAYGDDPALVGAMATFDGVEVLVLGQQKGRTTADNVRRNFAMARPWGYRKATRLMRLAARYGRPVVCFIDTPGAYPGIEAETHGQAEAISRTLETMISLDVPTIAVVIGEGGSGGALALGVADRVLMLEHSIYSVISPEGCAAILWRDATKAPQAATQLRLTSADVQRMGLCHEVLPEPPGGAHRDAGAMARTMGAALRRHLHELRTQSAEARLMRRYAAFRHMGVFYEGSEATAG